MPDALAYLFSLERLGMKFGLETISRLCQALDHPQAAFDSVLIAGTNGKGSVTAMVHRALAAAGYRAARYTSPHLERLEERYVVGDREVGTDDLAASAEAVRRAIDALLRSGAIAAPPTFFEMATAMAFELFRRAGVRIAVLEVGLGGRLDATNVVTPLVGAITSIDFDHEAQLGHTLEAIAFEKAGIIKPGMPVVCGPLAGTAESVVRRICAERAAEYIPAAEADAIDPASLALAGDHQRTNARIAARVLEELSQRGFPVGRDAVADGLSRVVWPGRLERFAVHGAEILLDAAHNPAGARALAAHLHHIGWAGCGLVFAAMRDKNVQAMLEALSPACGALVCTTADTPRAMRAAALAAVARDLRSASWTITVAEQPADALEHAVRHHRRVVVAGSIFLIGPVRGILRTR